MHAATSDERSRFFVYGTLRRGEYNHGYLADARLLGTHVTSPRYVLYDTGPYPAAATGGRTPVTGEVHAVDRRGFRLIERLEGYPHPYTREQIDTPFGPAWMYLWVAAIDPHWPRVAGDWADALSPGRPIPDV